MSKTIAIYGVQVLLGIVALASGYAKLTGMDIMVHHFEALGLGTGFRMIAGSAEILAGLCLLLPRGGVVGAVLLSAVMVGALGVTIGQVASAVAAPAYAQQYTISSPQPVSGPCMRETGRPVVVQRRGEWDI
jgi:uncharacterized membrane protein YphA (DoxX/SURF4 family)